MPKTTDITVTILREIRDEVRKTNERVDVLTERVDVLTGRVDAVGDRFDTVAGDLGRRIVESEIRTATALTELAGTVREMTGLLRAQGDLRPRVERCEQDIADIRRSLSHAT
jgi:hypothetical protein